MRKHIANIAVLVLVAAGTCGWAVAQAKEEPPDRAVVPLSNPAQPAKIEVSVMRGSITVRAYQGQDVIVEARTREKALSELGGPFSTIDLVAGAWAQSPATAASAKVRERSQKAAEEAMAATLANQERLAKTIQERAAGSLHYQLFKESEKAREEKQEKQKKVAGLRRLSGSSSGLEVEEKANVVKITTQSWKAATDLVIQVPVASSLEINSSMDGAVVVEGVSGEIDINNINGPVTLRNVSGNTLVHTVNGDIEAVISRVSSGKPLSFSTMTGDIDVTLPAAVKANLKMKNEQGEVYTDFEVDLTRQPVRSETAEKTDEGRYRITFDKSLVGLINGGGPEVSFNTFRGDIYIRKGK